MTHKDSICFGCVKLFDYGKLYRKDEILAVCLCHASRNAGNRKTCKDFEPIAIAGFERRKEIISKETR